MSNLRVEVWQSVIENNFFAAWNKLDAMGTDDSPYIVKAPGKKAFKIYIPQAGMLSKPLINPTEYPLQIEVRADDTLDYELDNLVMKPEFLNDFDVSLLSYDKMASVLQDMVGNIGEEYLYRALARWYPGNTNAVPTTGADVAATAPGATGTREALTIVDFRKAVEKLESQSIDGERIAVLPNSMFWQLVAEIEEKNWNVRLIEKDGLGMLEAPIYNTKITYFPKAARVLANGSAARLPGIGHAVTDSEAGYVYVKRAVSVSRGDVQYYDDRGNPVYQGDIVSANCWMGAKYRRLDKLGIVPIYQAT